MNQAGRSFPPTPGGYRKPKPPPPKTAPGQSDSNMVSAITPAAKALSPHSAMVQSVPIGLNKRPPPPRGPPPGGSLGYRAKVSQGGDDVKTGHDNNVLKSL